MKAKTDELMKEVEDSQALVNSIERHVITDNISDLQRIIGAYNAESPRDLDDVFTSLCGCRP